MSCFAQTSPFANANSHPCETVKYRFCSSGVCYANYSDRSECLLPRRPQQRPREPSSQRAYHTSTVSDWSRDGLRPDDMVNDDDADTGDEGDMPLMLPAPGGPAEGDQRGSESTAGSTPPGDGDGEEGPDESGEQVR